MERNTLLAIVLSVAVLFVYQSIFVPPKRNGIVNNSQISATQELTPKNTPAQTDVPIVPTETTSALNKTVDYTVSTTDTRFLYTKMGGSLHNIEFLKNSPFPLTDIFDVAGFESAPFEGEQIDDKTVVLSYKGKGREITKTFTLEDGNLIHVRLDIKNTSEMSNLNNNTITAFKLNTVDVESSNRESALFEYSVYANNKIFRKGSAIKFEDKNNKSAETKVNWVGFRDHYHTVVIKPEFETKGYVIKADNPHQLDIFLKLPDKSLEPGQSVNYDFSVYAGPQNPWAMAKYKQGFEKIVAFSNFIIIEWIAQGIYHTIPFLHSIFKSWGVAIILISAMLYGLTYPLTMKSMVSMRKMQEVQPKIAALRDRFKNDPQKLNMEMMEIYRREKINPFGGCLPFLIQMPFFMSLYQILWRAQYFQGQGFLWIKDLSQPDRLIIFSFNLPFFGNELNILPILTGCIMFLQQRISSKSMVVTDEQQIMQQKMMMYILPVMMTFMFYKFASSWAIYFLVFYILSTATQWRISKMTGKK
jgi:YidC/Oxa1 family membrane protein insertase